MPVPDTDFPKDELNSLLSALCDGQIDAAGITRCEEILAASRAARQHYHFYLDLHMDLLERIEAQKSVTLTKAIPFIQPHRRHSWLLSAAAVILLSAIAIFALRKQPPRSPTQAGNQQVAGKQIAQVVVSKEASWTGAEFPGKAGEILLGKSYQLESGEIAMLMTNGVQLSFRGPSVFRIESTEKMSLDSGEVAVISSTKLENFSILTPGAAFIDVGTSFTVKVEPAGDSSLVVHEGQVFANLLSENGSTSQSLAATAGEALCVNPTTRQISSVDPATLKPMMPITLPPEKLVIPAQYREQIKASKPIAYWTFEKKNHAQILNEVSDAYSLRMIGDVALETYGANTSAHLSAKEATGFLETTEPFPGLDTPSGQSIELWFYAEFRDEFTLANLHLPPSQAEVLSDPKGFELASQTLIEIMGSRGSSNPELIHQDYSIRHVHRVPPSKSSGYNAFSSAQYKARRWHHLAVVRSATEMITYLDGATIQNSRVSGESGVGSTLQLVLGRLRPSNYHITDRQFHGSIDEVAIYDRPLTAEEVSMRLKSASRSSR